MSSRPCDFFHGHTVVAAVTVAFARRRERWGPSWYVWCITLARWRVDVVRSREHDGRSLHGHTPDELSEYIEAEAAS